MNKILITGASGTLGKLLCGIFSDKNIPYTAISRQQFNIKPPGEWNYADLNSGSGLEMFAGDFDTVIHLASNASDKNSKNDTELTMEILNFCGKANVSHFIFMSIVGIDKIPYKYYEEKLASEKLVKGSKIPYTILRATQFHQFIDFILSKTIKFPIGLLPKNFKFQPIAPERAAAKLCEISYSKPLNGIINIGGIEILSFGNMAKDWLYAKNKKTILINLPLCGKRAKAFINGYNTCKETDPESISWKGYLKTKYKSI